MRVVCDFEAKCVPVIDGLLPPDERAALDAHQLRCERCAARLRDLAALRRTLEGGLRRRVPLAAAAAIAAGPVLDWAMLDAPPAPRAVSGSPAAHDLVGRTIA